MSDKITPYIYQLAEYFRCLLLIMMCCSYMLFYLDNNILHNLCQHFHRGKTDWNTEILTHCGKVPLSSKAATPSLNVCTDHFVLNTIMALYLQWSFPKAMLGYAFPLLCSVLIGMIGYILNLIFPNFEWENVTHIIKQSLPAIWRPWSEL